MLTYFLIGLTITTFRLVFDITIWNSIHDISKTFSDRYTNKTKDAVEDFFDKRWVYNITMILGYVLMVIWLLTLGLCFIWYITGNICE